MTPADREALAKGWPRFSGRSATGTRNVTKEGDTVSVDRTVTGSEGQSVTKQKEYELEDGRVESVERNVQATDKYGRTAEYEGKAERQGAGWTFEGEGTNRYGQEVDVEGAAVRGPYGTRAVADIDGGRYGDRTVAAWKPYGGPTYVTRLPPGYAHIPSMAGPTTTTTASTTGRTAASTTSCRRPTATAATRAATWRPR